MSLLPERVVANAMRAPSGDQAGPSSSPGLAVSCRWSVPSAAIVQISLPGSSPFGPRSKAIREPSGDQDGAESKAKLGWIIAASASGAALLIMLLAVVIAESVAKDNAKAATSQLGSDPDKQQEALNSLIRAPIRWFGIGELLVFALHLGSLALPALAAWQVFTSTAGKRGPPRGRDKRRFRDDDDDE